MVIADHDWWRCPKKECRAKWDYESKRCPSCGSSGVTEPAGEKHAKKTGLPYWMPDEPGTDANDYHQAHGVVALAKELRRVLRNYLKTPVATAGGTRGGRMLVGAGLGN